MSFSNRGTRTAPSGGESGHLLLVVMIGLVVMSIMLGAVVQQWSTVQRRENEEELIFRGNQYVKAIKLYQAEHGGALPTSLEILVKPGPRRLRYIRRLFRDPMVPDGKWGILLADPSGRGYINPNAPPPPTGEGVVSGLEDLGTGLKPDNDSMDKKLRASNFKNSAREKIFSSQSGFSSPMDLPSGDPDAKAESVTAPGQPVGPIVGVVSLSDKSSFRMYRQHENYEEWAFNIFEDGMQGGVKGQTTVSPVPTPGSGIGPGGQFGIRGGANGVVGGPAPAPMPGFPGVIQKPNHPGPQPPN
jgi:type II secretory pathway pseudopilin PulG